MGTTRIINEQSEQARDRGRTKERSERKRKREDVSWPSQYLVQQIKKQRALGGVPKFCNTMATSRSAKQTRRGKTRQYQHGEAGRKVRGRIDPIMRCGVTSPTRDAISVKGSRQRDQDCTQTWYRSMSACTAVEKEL